MNPQRFRIQLIGQLTALEQEIIAMFECLQPERASLSLFWNKLSSVVDTSYRYALSLRWTNTYSILILLGQRIVVTGVNIASSCRYMFWNKLSILDTSLVTMPSNEHPYVDSSVGQDKAINGINERVHLSVCYNCWNKLSLGDTQL